MKVVGIVGRREIALDNYKVIGCGEYYRLKLAQYADVLPIMLLPVGKYIYNDITIKDEDDLSEIEIRKLDKALEICDGIILTGGGNWYKYENYIIDYCIKRDKPLLGICLGLQEMNVTDNIINGGKYKSLEYKNTMIDHKRMQEKYAHKVVIIEGSKLYDILKKGEIMVNSRHDYHILGTLNFKVSALSEDNVIEAIEYPNKKFIIGVQWHPENLDDDESKKIFDKFVESLYL